MISLLLLLLATEVSAPPDADLPELVQLKQQDKPRPHPKLKLPKDCAIGPIIPGLMQGAVPQGLAHWKAQNWLLISCYFHHEESQPAADRTPSVVVAIDAETKKIVRCLTLVEVNGGAHTGHVGGLAVSDNYLWVASKQLYRAPLADVLAAPRNDHLRLQKMFHAECDASYVAYHDKQVWVGEFVATTDPQYQGNSAHYLKDRNGTNKHAWIAGYALDAADNPKGATGGKAPPPTAVLSVREHVQGLAFLDDRIILSTSYGRTKDSLLAAYANPLRRESKKPHVMVQAGGVKVPLWFLDGKNKIRETDFPPMSENITPYGKGLAVLCESGAAHYQKGGRSPLDSVVFFQP